MQLNQSEISLKSIQSSYKIQYRMERNFDRHRHGEGETPSASSRTKIKNYSRIGAAKSAITKGQIFKNKLCMSNWKLRDEHRSETVVLEADCTRWRRCIQPAGV